MNYTTTMGRDAKTAEIKEIQGNLAQQKQI